MIKLVVLFSFFLTSQIFFMTNGYTTYVMPEEEKTIEYDDAQRVTAVIYADGRKVVYEYDKNGNIVKTSIIYLSSEESENSSTAEIEDELTTKDKPKSTTDYVNTNSYPTNSNSKTDNDSTTDNNSTTDISSKPDNNEAAENHSQTDNNALTDNYSKTDSNSISDNSKNTSNYNSEVKKDSNNTASSLNKQIPGINPVTDRQEFSENASNAQNQELYDNGIYTGDNRSNERGFVTEEYTSEPQITNETTGTNSEENITDSTSDEKNEVSVTDDGNEVGMKEKTPAVSRILGILGIAGVIIGGLYYAQKKMGKNS